LRLLTARANPDIGNADGNTALHIAALHNRSSCLQQLLQHGGDQSIANVYGLSARVIAERM
jgi:ankyrin repeat protein